MALSMTEWKQVKALLSELEGLRAANEAAWRRKYELVALYGSMPASEWKARLGAILNDGAPRSKEPVIDVSAALNQGGESNG